MEQIVQERREQRERLSREEQWKGKSTISKAHAHLERAASTINEIPGVGSLQLQQASLFKKKI